MDAWDPSLVKAVAGTLATPDAPRTDLRGFLELWHSFAVTSAYMREKPLAECITALKDFLAAHPAVPSAVRATLNISAPPNEALACAVTVAAALYASEISNVFLDQMRKVTREFLAERKAADPPAADLESMKTYLNVYLYPKLLLHSFIVRHTLPYPRDKTREGARPDRRLGRAHHHRHRCGAHRARKCQRKRREQQRGHRIRHLPPSASRSAQ